MYSRKTIGELRCASQSLGKASEKDSDAIRALRNAVADHKDAGDGFELVVCESVAALCVPKAATTKDSKTTGDV